MNRRHVVIEVIINFSDMINVFTTDYFKWHILDKLEKAGVPMKDKKSLLDIPEIDFTKGVLTAFDDPLTLDKIYRWKPINITR